MATVTGITAERALDIENASITSGYVNDEGNLTLVRRDGTEVDGGPIPSLSPVPTYAGVRSGSYDADKNLYVPKGARLGAFRNRIHAAKHGRGTTIAVCGSSTVAGNGATSISEGMAYKLDELFAANGYPIQGSGLRFPGPGKQTADSRWTFSGTTTSYLTKLYLDIASGAYAQHNVEIVGDRVRVHYANDAGPFNISIDGGAATLVTPTNVAGVSTWTSGALSAAAHTVRVTGTGALAARLIAVETYMNAGGGINISVAGLGGSGAGVWATNGTYDPLITLVKKAPALSIIAGNINDFGTGVTREAMKANMATAVELFKYFNGGVLLALMPISSSYVQADYEAHASVLYDVADEKLVPLLDMNDRWGPYTEITGATYNGDGTHPSNAGHMGWARAIFDIVGWTP